MNAGHRLEMLGLTLPPPAVPIGNYRPYRLVGNLLFLSGVGPRHPDGSITTGKVGGESLSNKATRRRGSAALTSWSALSMLWGAWTVSR